MDEKVAEVLLADQTFFETLNGLWKGKKPPFTSASVIRNTNFTSAGHVDYSDVAVLEVEQKQIAKRKLQRGDIIIERSGGGPKQPVGRVVYFDRDDGTFSFSNFTSTVRVRDRESFEPKFVFYRLLELYRSGGTEDIQRFTTGIRNLDFAAYKERAAIALLPRLEQRAIVHLLELVRSAIGVQERLLTVASDLKRTLLDTCFTIGLRGEELAESDVGAVPRSWKVSQIGAIARLTSGGTPSRTKPEYWVGGEIPWVKTAEVDNCVITEVGERITETGLKNSSAKLFPPGTLLMAMYGQGVTRGKVALLGMEATTNQACVAFFPSPEVSAEYLYYLFQARYKEIREYGHGANQKNLSAEIIKGISIALPTDTGEQAEAVQVLQQVDERIRIACGAREVLEGLFHTVLHATMTGALRIPEPAWHELEVAAKAAS